jgi:hypothetical protein
MEGVEAVSSFGIIAAEQPRQCELCKKLSVETRPYGPNGERVCVECGMKDYAAVERGVGKLIFGDPPSPKSVEQEGE